MGESNILAISPGSTFTKIAVYKNRKQVFLTNIKHDTEALHQYEKIADQFEYRKNTITEELKKADINTANIDIVIGRGGLLKPIEGGVYQVNEAMIRDIRNPMGEHESNLGGLIAYEIAKEIGKNVMAIIVDPTCVDELEDIARISGMPELPRRSFLHTLNQRAVARTYARDIGKKYEEINVIVAHMSGGISVGAHRHGRIIDVNNGLNGDGPLSPERSGGLPVGQLVELCFSEKFSKQEILKKIKGNGGLFAYLGTSDTVEIEKRIAAGDNHAKLIYDAMSYQVAKEIGALGAVLKGEVDGILLTGGIAYEEMVTNHITERVKHIGPVKVYPGEGEMEAMAMYGFLVLSGEVSVKEYK